jgi:hypothetical protein
MTQEKLMAVSCWLLAVQRSDKHSTQIHVIDLLPVGCTWTGQQLTAIG